MKRTDKLYVMLFGLTLITTITFLSGCGSKKNAGCDAYSSYEIKSDPTMSKVENYSNIK